MYSYAYPLLQITDAERASLERQSHPYLLGYERLASSGAGFSHLLNICVYLLMRLGRYFG
jgi:hypothetical protein